MHHYLTKQTRKTHLIYFILMYIFSRKGKTMYSSSFVSPSIASLKYSTEPGEARLFFVELHTAKQAFFIDLYQ